MPAPVSNIDIEVFMEKLPERHSKTWKRGHQALMQLWKILVLSGSKQVQSIIRIIQASIPSYITRLWSIYGFSALLLPQDGVLESQRLVSESAHLLNFILFWSRYYWPAIWSNLYSNLIFTFKARFWIQQIYIFFLNEW